MDPILLPSLLRVRSVVVPNMNDRYDDDVGKIRKEGRISPQICLQNVAQQRFKMGQLTLPETNIT